MRSGRPSFSRWSDQTLRLRSKHRPPGMYGSAAGFRVEGRTDQAVALMKQIKIYPLAKPSLPPSMEFLNGSGKTIDTLFPDNFHYFELFAKLVDDWQISAF